MDGAILESGSAADLSRSDASVPSHTFADPSIGVPVATRGRVDHRETKRPEEEPKEFALKWQQPP
jgi:hypothetical protein